jgi:Tn3 transposase DDE domain
VQGSRQFKDFEEYLLSTEKFASLKEAKQSPLSDQYAPFHTKAINVGVRDATYVLDGLLYHESDIRIEEHYIDHVFALMHLLGFRFAPRIRDLADKRLFVVDSKKEYASINTMIGDAINVKHIKSHWDEILRLAASIKQGTVTASLILRKLGSYPRQNGLAIALREIGRIERTLYLSDRFALITSSVGHLGSSIQSQTKGKSNGFISGLLLGSALGLVWTPCAGPILVAVTTLVATQ